MCIRDRCDTTQPCGQRDSTTVPTQALTLMNNQFSHERSRHLAAGILAAIKGQAAQVTETWKAVLRRPPTDGELQLGKKHVSQQKEHFEAEQNGSSNAQVDSSDVQALASLALVLFNSNEFLYID